MRLSVKAKLAGAFGLIIVLTGMVGAGGYWKLSALDATNEALVSQRVKIQRLAGELAMSAKLVPDIKRTTELVEEITAARRGQVEAISGQRSTQAETLQGTIVFFNTDRGERNQRVAISDAAVVDLRARAITMRTARAEGRAEDPATRAKTRLPCRSLA